VRIALALLLILIVSNTSFAGEEIVFSGVPSIKISEGGIERTQETLSQPKALDFKCVISKVDDKYYWTTRENTPMVPIESGAYITFVALNGSGYVRVLSPDMKSVASILSQTEEKFDYTEHLLLGLRSIIYYGTRED
jgi:hypothetical protein